MSRPLYCAAGDVHGALDRLYADVLAFEAGLGEAVARARPKACFFGHHHQRLDTEVAGVRCVGLNAVGRPGNLVAFRIDGHTAGLVAEWPPHPIGRTTNLPAASPPQIPATTSQ